MAIALADPAIAVVDFQLRALGAANLAGRRHGLGFALVVAAGPLPAAALHVPAPSLVRHYMMGVAAAFTRHIYCLPENSGLKSMPTPNLGRAGTVVKDKKYVYSELGVDGEVKVTTALGEKIRRLRQKQGYTLEKLADLSGSSKSYIWELENKNPPRPSADKVAKIAAALKVTTDFLLDDSGQALEADAQDKAFFNRYRDMDPDTKEKIRTIVEMWDKKGAS